MEVISNKSGSYVSYDHKKNTGQPNYKLALKSELPKCIARPCPKGCKGENILRLNLSDNKPEIVCFSNKNFFFNMFYNSCFVFATTLRVGFGHFGVIAKYW